MAKSNKPGRPSDGKGDAKRSNGHKHAMGDSCPGQSGAHAGHAHAHAQTAADGSRRSFSELGTGESDGLEPVLPLDLQSVKTVDDLVRGLSSTAFAGRRCGEAADVLETMVRDPDCAVVLTISGAMTIAKMGL